MNVVRKFLFAALLTASASLPAFASGSLFDEAPWYIGAGIGRVHFEGDEPVNPGQFITLRVGYDFNEFFSTEAYFDYMPSLDNSEFDNPDRTELPGSIWAMRGGLDFLAHLRNAKNLRWDPYLSLGVNEFYYEEDLGDGNPQLSASLGAGMFYHFNDTWSLRGDFKTEVSGDNVADFNGDLLVTVNYRFGTEIEPVFTAVGGDLDSDGDGLLDTEEATIGTDPHNPDTDADGLGDGEEVKQFKTDPLNADTDWDALKDGAEVLTYKTDPLDKDTDDGGVLDGHEVIEDQTNPLFGQDDLIMFTLNIEFDYDKSTLRSQYPKDLDVIIKMLQRDPGATARVEGHADKRKKSTHKYNQDLSERRAKVVKDYISNAGGINPSRLQSKGFSFDRPVAPNDTEANMQKNRRTEVYIRPSGNVDLYQVPGAPVKGGVVPK